MHEAINTKNLVEHTVIRPYQRPKAYILYSFIEFAAVVFICSSWFADDSVGCVRDMIVLRLRNVKRIIRSPFGTSQSIIHYI
jgi:hypothetical protein